MNVLLFVDSGSRIPLSEDLEKRIRGAATGNGHIVETVELAVGDLANCSGCLLCLKGTGGGMCVTKDRQESLQRKAEGRDLVVFLTPVSFGQCASTIKNALDKGVSMWFGAAAIAPVQFIVGYGIDVDEEERTTFIDCVRKHMGKADVIHSEFKELRIEAFVARSMEDTGAIVEKIEEYLRGRVAS
jgi:multimeric flavodoxin WrbA